MKGKLIFKLGALSTILSFLLVIPALGQTVRRMRSWGNNSRIIKRRRSKN